MEEPVERLLAIGPYERDDSSRLLLRYTWRRLSDVCWEGMGADLQFLVGRDVLLQSRFNRLLARWQQYQEQRKRHADSLCHLILQAVHSSENINPELGPTPSIHAIQATCQHVMVSMWCWAIPGNMMGTTIDACFRCRGYYPMNFVLNDQSGLWDRSSY